MNNLTNEAITLIDPKCIAFDPKNPRNMSKEQIENEIEFKDLRKSVGQFNVLVPLIVRSNNSKIRPYRLVDGERRLRAALAERKNLVPIYMTKDDETDGRILAYHIHMLRKQWDKRCEISSIREIKDELCKKYQGIEESELFKKILEITNHKEHELKDLLTLLKYSDSAIIKVQEGNLAMSYLIQIDSSFLIPLKRELPKLYEQYGDENLRKILVDRAKDGKLNNTRYLMENVLEVFRDCKNKVKLNRIIKKFLDDPQKNIDIVVDCMKQGSESKNKKPKRYILLKRKARKGTLVPSQIDHKTELLNIEKNIISNNIFDLLFHYLREAVIEFEKRTSTKFKTEAELQNFIYSIIRSLFSSIEFEDPTEKKCGKSNRLDFVLKDHKVIIEVKYVRDKEHAKRISEELSVDYPRYLASPHGGTILNYIYDPEDHITNHTLFLKELKELLPIAHHYVQ